MVLQLTSTSVAISIGETFRSYVLHEHVHVRIRLYTYVYAYTHVYKRTYLNNINNTIAMFTVTAYSCTWFHVFKQTTTTTTVLTQPADGGLQSRNELIREVDIVRALHKYVLPAAPFVTRRTGGGRGAPVEQRNASGAALAVAQLREF